MGNVERPSVAQVWSWLGEIPDPEIPVISIVDLGIVRTIEWQDTTLVVSVTPTYSACPATSVINLEIERALADKGINRLRLDRQLSPPWTTDWMSAKGRQKLQSYGIAAPIPGTSACGGHHRSVIVACPRCGSENTERISQFGSTPCKANYRCTACLEPFDYFKCI